MNDKEGIYEGGIPIQFTISLELRKECVVLFEELDMFSDPVTLRKFLEMRGLLIVIRCIPKTKELEYEELIERLISRGRTFTEPALLILLDALAEKYKEDAKGKDCLKLIEKLKDELAKTPTFEQAKDYERLVVRSISSDARGIGKLAEQWIEEAGDSPDELALRITLAVFHSTAFEVIEEAKNDLLERLQQLTSPLPATPPLPMMRRLEKAGARETDGAPPDWRKVIELDNPEIAGEALRYVWRLNRETKWRQLLIEWLTKYAAGKTAPVRTRAAVAAGKLAIQDYRFVRDYLLERWVSENTAEYRMAIGMALGVIAREEHLAAETMNLLQRWLESDRLDKRWAAMRAYIYVGLYCRSVSEVIARWRKFAASESDSVFVLSSADEPPQVFSYPLYMSLLDAMVRFFVAAAQQPAAERRRLYTGILEGLHTWIAEGKSDRGLGLYMFFMIGEMRVLSDEPPDANSPPLLLQFADEQPSQSEYRKQLASLFELLMRKGETIVETKRLLCAWLGWANGLERGSQLYEARLQTLMKDMMAADSSGRMRGKLILCLRDCGRNRSAQRILATL